jgi:hypothetical protein
MYGRNIKNIGSVIRRKWKGFSVIGRRFGCRISRPSNYTEVKKPKLPTNPASIIFSF